MLLLVAAVFAALSGCHLVLPEVSYQPIVHNPFPQLSRVAVAPFFNHSDEPTVDGRQFAMAYFAELQETQGYEVVPVSVVEAAMVHYQIRIDGPESARKLAQVLGVDAIVVGTVTDFSPYYPPRCGMRIEWYAANPGFHEIPAGYGLPWGTPEEEFIPSELVFESEMALARAQMATQSPDCSGMPATLEELAPTNEIPPLESPVVEQPEALPPPSEEETTEQAEEPSDDSADGAAPSDSAVSTAPWTALPSGSKGKVQPAMLDAPLHNDDSTGTASGGAIGSVGPGGMSAQEAADATGPMLPPDWPDARGLVPAGPSPMRPACVPNNGPVMTHTKIYRGSDPEFTAALASYVEFRDDARFGGWRGYLERSDDFIRFCCHLHIVEMLSARGGGDESQVVRRWSESR
jgi:hypothetical protein